MKHTIYTYTPSSDRSIVYEGTFLEGDDVDINIGDEILVFHVCRYCNTNILMKVIDKKLAYYFQNIPQYDYIVENGSAYKCNIKHVSLYDQIAGECKMSD